MDDSIDPRDVRYCEICKVPVLHFADKPDGGTLFGRPVRMIVYYDTCHIPMGQRYRCKDHPEIIKLGRVVG